MFHNITAILIKLCAFVNLNGNNAVTLSVSKVRNFDKETTVS